MKTAFLTLTLAAATPAGAEDLTAYLRAVDASAAVAIDDSRFAAASDEENVIRIYNRENSAEPLQEIGLSAFLQVDPASPETDIEAAARIGQRVFWITSHGRNKDGKYRGSRYRFFATDIDLNQPKLLVPRGEPYKDLLRDLLAHKPLEKFGLSAASRLAPKAPGGLNIEGLVATPDGHLLIGFRSPVPNGQALIVPLLNPDQMIQGTAAKLGTPIQLKLNGLGIRSMDFWDGEYGIVAGSTEGNERFELFRWKGGDAVPVRVVGGIPGTVNAESLVLWPDANRGLQFLSDDSGEPQNAPKRLKKLKGAKSFRSASIPVD
ncbi:MAG TPA: DUF3616 domain-containing protein [Verrucomicrobiae bacterium]|nr:DUF3616 domain-containing protein [Verrucomicrobiae bacterium]